MADQILDPQGPPVMQSVVAEGWGKKIGLTGPNAFPWFVILVLLGTITYMLNFNLRSWGEPFNLKTAFQDQAVSIVEHTAKMSSQHDDLTLAVRWNTYVQYVCSAQNSNSDARKKCAEIDLMKPEPEDQRKRRFRVQPGD